MVGLIAPATAGASPFAPFVSRTVYVSTTGSPGAPGRSCTSAAYSSIQAAIEAAPSGGTVVVCPGTYDQSATVDKSLTLSGTPGAIIDAAGQPYGIGAAASWVTITGLTVEGANASVNSPTGPTTTLADGIVTAGDYATGAPVTADHVTITHDVTENNAGSGIDLNSTSYSVATDNYSTGNGVGINVSDDFSQPASDNTITGNTSVNNPGGCGIALAEHTGKGIFGNNVADNVANDNGLGSSTAPEGTSGSGIVLAGAAPLGGGVYDNRVDGNTFDGNGHAGVELHGHVPGLNFGGNLVTGNRIGTDNVLGDTDDSSTTGVYLGDASPLTITVTGNVISGDQVGIFTAGTITVVGEHFNQFVHVGVPAQGVPTYP
jgi:hypothetical protein